MMLPPVLLAAVLAAASEAAAPLRLESAAMLVEVDPAAGRWSLTDKASGVRWPTEGTASPGEAAGLEGKPAGVEARGDETLRIAFAGGRGVLLALRRGGRDLELRWEGEGLGDVRALGDLLRVADREDGFAIVPCREGLLVSARSGQAFRRAFGTSDYEGCHMNLLGFAKRGSALLVTWEGAYVFPELSSELRGEGSSRQTLTALFSLRRSARSLRITPLGPGDWNLVAAGYREIAESKGLAVTLRDKIRREPSAGKLAGASNFKLWTCLARRMNEESTAEESVRVRWTFDEAAQIAEHLRRDLEIDRCLFMMGGWTEGGYDCRHPDNLPANPECGGNEALADAVRRIQSLGYVGCLHDNYQDMYRDAKSWDPAAIEKRPDGSLIQGGRWLGGRAYMVCAPKQLELARRPQNLPGIHELFPVQSYFIDTTYAVGPRECHDPAHPLSRDDDIAWKIRLSDYAREVFGLFGSECGREWALPHSDFFEGLVGVSGKYYHNLDPASLGAVVIPFWEMVYHDCQICWGKYGYSGEAAAEYVAHHALCARPLHYHSVPDHLYWKEASPEGPETLEILPRIESLEAEGPRSLRIAYAWDVKEEVRGDWRIFIHFGTSGEILFQDDHSPEPPTSSWKAGDTVRIGPHRVSVPDAVRRQSVDVYAGLFQSASGPRAPLSGADSQQRVKLGRLVLEPEIRFERDGAGPDRSIYNRSGGGWAEGMHPLDAFIKNTHEILGPLHAATAHERLEKLEFLTEDRSVRRAVYGSGDGATAVIANFGESSAEVDSKHGGRVMLGPWGIVVDGPRFAAFAARRWGGREYERGALFTLKPLDGETLEVSRRIRVYHGFGDPSLRWKGAVHEVRREAAIEVAE